MWFNMVWPKECALMSCIYIYILHVYCVYIYKYITEYILNIYYIYILYICIYTVYMSNTNLPIQYKTLHITTQSSRWCSWNHHLDETRFEALGRPTALGTSTWSELLRGPSCTARRLGWICQKETMEFLFARPEWVWKWKIPSGNLLHRYWKWP